MLSLTWTLVRRLPADYYVSTLGSDSNPGTAAQPLRTITAACNLATAGTTITVLLGVYADYQSGWSFHLNKNGTATSPIVLLGDHVVVNLHIADGVVAGDVQAVGGFKGLAKRR